MSNAWWCVVLHGGVCSFAWWCVALHGGVCSFAWWCVVLVGGVQFCMVKVGHSLQAHLSLQLHVILISPELNYTTF